MEGTLDRKCSRCKKVKHIDEFIEPNKLCNKCIADKNKMKPTNPNADTYVEKQRLNTYLSQFPANPFVEHPDLTH